MCEPNYMTISISCIALAVSIAVYVIQRRTLTAKFMDRLYELNKLIMTYPDAYDVFLNASSLENSRELAAARIQECKDLKVTAVGMAVQVEAFGYFYLNFFDEIFGAYYLRLEPALDDASARAWRSFIVDRAKNPIIQELIDREFSPVDLGRPVPGQVKADSIFHAELLKFLKKSTH